ncbi:hypothetical protein GCM10009574_027900 [Streptomyces asiaticus]
MREPFPELSRDAAAVAACGACGGVKLIDQFVADATHDPLPVAVTVLSSAFLCAGHVRIMTGGLPPVKECGKLGGKPPMRRNWFACLHLTS